MTLDSVAVRRWAVGVMAAMALVGSVLGAPVATAEDLTSKKQRIDAKIDDAHDEVLAYNKKVAQATRQVLDARAQQPAAQQNYERAVGAQRQAKAASAKAAAQLEQATSDVLRTERGLAKVEQRLADLEASVGDFARRAYQMGPFAELEMLLEAKDPSEFTNRLAAIRTVSKANADALGKMDEDRADLAFAEIKLGALRDEATNKQLAAQARLREAKEAAEGAAAAKQVVDALVAQEQSALSAARENKASVKAQYERLAAEQTRIQAEIVAASRQLSKETGVKTGLGGTGKWLFPVAGASIGSDAGWRFHPILHYTRCHAGSDISAPSGTPIMAVDNGVVVSAGGNGGYGNYTVVAHGGGVTSAYAHQSSMAVSAGESVKRGQVIGFVGSTGLSSGPHLHFEARIAGAPWNPRGWFGTGPKAPVCV